MKITNLIQEVNKSVVRVISDHGRGTGIIIDYRGIVLTNRHIINSDKGAVLVSFDGRIHIGRMLYAHSYRDIAFLYFGSKQLPAANLNYSKQVKIGEDIITIGHPRDLPYSVTKGIISYPSRFREQEPALPYIQFDAPAHPGSSGGALVNLRGQVIGIVSSGVGESLNLAIPISEIKFRIGDIKKRLSWYKASQYCSICGAANEPNKRHCGKCGTTLLSTVEFKTIIKNKSINAKDYVICSKCKNPNILKDPENTTCGVCFSPLFSHKNNLQRFGQKKIFCPVCKKKSMAQLQYCSNCGKDLMSERRDQ